MRCPKCQFENAPAAKFCSNCGMYFHAQCPVCAFYNPQGFRFCGRCGRELFLESAGRLTNGAGSAAVALTAEQPAIALEPERRPLTIMFCDLVGSTALSARLDPEELREVLLAYRQACAEAIQRFGGLVARYVGDGLLIYFGYPEAHDDDAVRAVRAALGIIAGVNQLGTDLESKLGTRLDVHIGVHTGEVVAGELGTGANQEKSAVVGEAPNVAARLQDAAGPGTIVVSEVTFDLIEHVFECEALPETRIEGISKPVAAFKVIRERASWRNIELFKIKALTPLLGRNEELLFLQKQWSRVQEGNGQVQLLSGEPGIGKSRLLHSLAALLSSEPCVLMQCQCLPHFSNSALFPFIDLLQRELGFEREDPAREKFGKLQAGFESGRLPQHEALPWAALLLSLPLPPELTLLRTSPRVQRERMMDWLLTWVVSNASKKPCVLIIEDIHWADASTLDFLTQLLDQVSSGRIFLLMTFRPEFTPPWPMRSLISHMALTRLSSRQAREMVGNLTKGTTLPDQLLEQVVTRTDGVPLFIEELTKMVMESGTLFGKDDRRETSGPPPPMTIPEMLRGSLVARLDRLGTAKGLAQLAAVIGREFPYRLVQAVSQKKDSDLKEGLAQLVDAELLFQRGLPPNATYIFKHALIQDAAYLSLLKTKRAQYHQQAATVLVEQFPAVTETHPELVAHHYTEAGSVEQAAGYWHRAGMRALEASADVEAVAHLSKGLEQLASLPSTPSKTEQEVSCLITLGAALTAIKGYGASDVVQTYARAYALCEQLGDTKRLFAALTGLHSFYQVRGPLTTAREIAERLLQLAQQSDDKSWLAQAHRRLGWCLFCLGRMKSGKEHLEFALGLYDRLRLLEHTRVYGAHPWAVGFANSALLEWFMGFPDNATERSRKALALARELSRPLILAYALCMSAAVHQCRGESKLTLQFAEEALAFSTEHGLPYWMAWSSVLQGWAMASTEQVEEGLARLRDGLKMYSQTGAELFMPSSLALLGESYQRAGRIDEALAAVTRALHSPELRDGYFYAAEIHRLKGELLIERGNDEGEGEACMRQALALAKDQEATSLELRAAASLAELLKRQGKRSEARRLLSEVLTKFTQGAGTADPTRARALLDSLG